MVDSQVSVIPNIVAGTIAGLVSGLLVSLTLWAVNHFSKPKFEYFEAGSGLGHLFYNRYWPVVIGGSFVLGHGPALIERNARGGTGGFFMAPKGDQVFAISYLLPRQSVSLVGEIIDISYRRVSWRYLWDSNARDSAYKLVMDPVKLYPFASTGKKPLARPENRSNSKSKVSYKGWKLKQIALKPSQTRSS